MVILFAVVLGLIDADTAQIDSDEEVAYFGPYLYWGDGDELTVTLRGRLMGLGRTGMTRRAAFDRVIGPSLFRYIGKKPSDYDEAARELMYERLLPFLADGESREALRMRLVGRGGAATVTLPKTDSGGHFSLATAKAGDHRIADLIQHGSELHVQAVLTNDDARRFATQLRVPPRNLELLVISDLDDTVRIAEVLNRPRMVERVFLCPYEAVPGMSSLYRQLADRGAWFHFVSGSPWQIVSVIEEFLLVERFPPAVLHCRQISWDFWNSDPLHTKQFKVTTIEKLLEQFSGAKVLLIGDDGEHDPEAYTEICRAHTERVAGVWIRQVRPEPPGERLAAAKSLLGETRVVAFQDPEKLVPIVEQVAR